METKYIIFTSVFYSILLTIFYFGKKRVQLLESKIYSYLIISNLLGIILESLSVIFVTNNATYPFLAELINKVYLIYLIIWITLFTVYVFIVSQNNTLEGNYLLNKRIVNIIKLVTGVLCFFICLAPLHLVSNSDGVYSYGIGVNLIYLYSGICILIMLYLLIRYIKSIDKRKFIPLIVFLTMGIAVINIQGNNPYILLLTSLETFITFLMYFTIENPDVQMIEELNHNRDLVTKTNESRSNFLFAMTNEIRNPINNILEISSADLEVKDFMHLKMDVLEINNESRNLSFLVNKAINESTINIANLKVVENRYNVHNSIEKVKITKEKLVSPEVEFRTDISTNIPKFLCADVHMIELVVGSIINNAIKYTKKGFVAFNINAIIKYDICRMIIIVEDSGIGMSIEKVNKLLRLDEELSEKETERLNTNDVNINTAKHILNKLGGSLMIRSEEGKGTVVTIVIDQKIDEESFKEIQTLDGKLSNHKKKILVASSDLEFLKKITKQVSNYGYNIETSMYAEDIFNRLRVGEVFDYILIDDEIEQRALCILNELKKNINFKTDVIVLLDKNKDFIKEHFLEDGFKDYLLKSDLTKEVERIFK